MAAPGKQSPAEPQEAVEKLAKKFWSLRTFADNLPSWEELSDEERASKLDHARSFLADLTPLLPGSSYVRELRERLEKLQADLEEQARGERRIDKRLRTFRIAEGVARAIEQFPPESEDKS